MENNRRKFGDTTGKRKQYDNDVESASSGEEKEEEEEEYEVQDDSAKKEDCSNEVFSKKRKCGKNTAEVTAEKSQILQQVAEYVSKKRGRGQLIVNF